MKRFLQHLPRTTALVLGLWMPLMTPAGALAEHCADAPLRQAVQTAVPGSDAHCAGHAVQAVVPTGPALLAAAAEDCRMDHVGLRSAGSETGRDLQLAALVPSTASATGAPTGALPFRSAHAPPPRTASAPIHLSCCILLV